MSSMADNNSGALEGSSQVEQDLILSIREHRIVRLRYDLDIRDRVFEPYVLFKDSQGRVMVGGRRVLDENDLLKPPAMRQFAVELINALEVTEETFEVDDRFDSRNLPLSNQIFEAVDQQR
ncbi:MAG TPA: WYL domain-containing protein [Gammaproteobacteria bacterium]|nr:WYL domain-containing protein [Gammaproteobacteria bacterium]